MNDLAAIVLAAGSSQRMPGIDKLFLELDGRPIISHCLETISALGLRQTIFVCGDNLSKILQIAAPFSAEVISNARHECGMGTSIATGIGALSASVKGAFICLGDMPFVSKETFFHLAEAFEKQPAAFDIVAPTFQNKRGHPVLFSNRLFPALQDLSIDHGAKHIIKSAGDRVQTITTHDRGVITDIDTPHDLHIARQQITR